MSGAIFENIIQWFQTVLKKKPPNRGEDDIETYKSGLGEIDFYWGKRLDARDAIKKYLKQDNLKEIFIAAIGFGTINAITDTDVIENFKKLIAQPNSTFKITFVLPDTDTNLKKYRPDGGITLSVNFTRGRDLLKKFIIDLAMECNPGSHINMASKVTYIESYIFIKAYTDKAIPRHFILQGKDGGSDPDPIFVGSYLGHTEGKQSYLMKLIQIQNDKNPIADKHYMPGLFNLFVKEIDSIKTNSIVENSIFEEIKQEK
jgi:hypothetical protein